MPPNSFAIIGVAPIVYIGFHFIKKKTYQEEIIFSCRSYNSTDNLNLVNALMASLILTPSAPGCKWQGFLAICAATSKATALEIIVEKTVSIPVIFLKGLFFSKNIDSDPNGRKKTNGLRNLYLSNDKSWSMEVTIQPHRDNATFRNQRAGYRKTIKLGKFLNPKFEFLREKSLFKNLALGPLKKQLTPFSGALLLECH